MYPILNSKEEASCALWVVIAFSLSEKLNA